MGGACRATRHLTLDVRNGYERHQQRVVSRPWTASATYRGAPIGRWTPRLSAGARYVRAPIAWYRARVGQIPFYGNARQGREYSDRTSAEVTAGADLRLTRRVALRGDVQRLLRHAGSPYDRRTTASFGLIWRMR